jgi:GNAT superfamily N-acetyltransferase
LQIRYRALNVSDDSEIARVAEIHEMAPRYWTRGHVPEPGQIRRRIEQLKSPAGCLDRFFQIAETAEGTIAGFHWVDLEELDGGKVGHIKSLWVDDAFQHMGIAAGLKKNGESWAKSKGATCMKTTVHANNTRMIEFNLRSGFEQGFIEMTKKL